MYHDVLTSHRGVPEDMIVLAGPCSVESEAQIEAVLPVLVKCGVTYARGGVYRAGTYPRPQPFSEWFGLQETIAKVWSAACRKAGLKVVMEVLDVREAGKMSELSDAFQVGARHMQDYALLVELSQYDRPVFLKRAVGAKLDEWLGAAEYLLKGKARPVLVERGISTFNDHCRWTPDIGTIAAAKTLTDLPVIVDASHGTGRRDLVRDVTLGGIAAGADGFLVEAHPDPCNSLSDSQQAYPLDRLEELVAAARRVREARQ